MNFIKRLFVRDGSHTCSNELPANGAVNDACIFHILSCGYYFNNVSIDWLKDIIPHTKDNKDFVLIYRCADMFV